MECRWRNRAYYALPSVPSMLLQCGVLPQQLSWHLHGTSSADCHGWCWIKQQPALTHKAASTGMTKHALTCSLLGAGLCQPAACPQPGHAGSALQPGGAGARAELLTSLRRMRAGLWEQAMHRTCVKPAPCMWLLQSVGDRSCGLQVSVCSAFNTASTCELTATHQHHSRTLSAGWL